MFSLRLTLLKLLLCLLCLACMEARELPQKDQLPDLNPTIESVLGDLKLKKNRGHIIFSCERKLCSDVRAISIQQPSATVTWISEERFALTDLHPQTHSILVEKTDAHGLVAAFYKDLIIDAEKYVEVGVPPFEKTGSLSGRIIDALSSESLPNALVSIQELGRSTQSNAQGEFKFEGLPVGQWHLTAQSAQHGLFQNERIEVFAGKQTDGGDFWLGSANLAQYKPELVNGLRGIIAEPVAKLRLTLPQGARFITVETTGGESLLKKSVARRNLDIPLPRSLSTTLILKLYDTNSKTLGALTLPINFDPFSGNGQLFSPEVRIENRVISSPQRTFTLQLPNLPAQAVSVRTFIDGTASDWQALQETLTVTLPKSNAMCGQRLLGVEFKNSEGFISRLKEIPITLSCFERIPHRAAIEKIVGIDNAAVWTGTHAFVWSGKQFDYSRRASIWGGSDSAETVNSQKALHTYKYMDTGYILQPSIDPTSGQPSQTRIEFIVTDSAPAPRVLPGVAGHNNWVAVYGGENESGPIADGGLFNIANNGWISMNGPDAPSARIKPSVVFIDSENILVWGGYTRTQQGFELPLNDGALYNLKTHRWKKMSSVATPSARMYHIGVWSGTEFFVMGGALPGGIEQYSAAKYNPQTDSWTALPNFSRPLTYMSAVFHAGHILLYGRNNNILVYRTSDNTVTFERTLNILKWNIKPSLVLTQHPAHSNKRLLWVFGGGASLIESDANEYLFTLPYDPTTGTFDSNVGNNQYVADSYELLRQNYFPSGTYNGLNMAKCCVDFLGFEFSGKVFAINGTEISNTTVYVDIKASKAADGSTNNYTSTFYTSKTYNSRMLVAENNEITTRLIDIPRPSSNPGVSPLGPYHLHRTDPPTWDASRDELIFYGGIYNNPLRGLYQQDGLIYNLQNRMWRSIPRPTSEPTYNDSQEGSQTFSRFETINFVMGDAFYLLAGYRYDGPNSGKNFLYNGLKTPLGVQPTTSPLPILTNSTFDFAPLGNTKSSSRWDSNPPCVTRNGVLLAGGLRKADRTGEGFTNTALVTEKVFFNPQTDSFIRTSVDPLGSRGGMTVVSTNEQCILWGGYTADQALFQTDAANTFASIRERMSLKNTGALYNPSEDRWTDIPTLNAPPTRAFMHGVWTGQEALLWGGSPENSPSVSKDKSKEKGIWLFNPQSMRWTSLGSVAGEPPYSGEERPVWTGRHMLIWKSNDAEYIFQFTPSENKWIRMQMPYGFNYRVSGYIDHNITWVGNKLFIMPYSSEAPSLMALYVPPDP